MSEKERGESVATLILSVSLSPALARTTFLPGPFVLNFRGWQRKNLPVVLIQQMWFLFLPCTHTHAYTGFSFAHTIATFTVSASFSFFYLAFSLRFLHLSRCLLFMLIRSLSGFILLLFCQYTNKTRGQTQTTNKQQLDAYAYEGARRRQSITVDNAWRGKISTTTKTTPRKYLIKPKYLI